MGEVAILYKNIYKESGYDITKYSLRPIFFHSNRNCKHDLILFRWLRHRELFKVKMET